jgi:hypothetical protein
MQMQTFAMGPPAWRGATGRRLALALAISVALHVAIASRMRAPESPTPPPPIQATLVAVKEKPLPAPPPPIERRPALAAKAPAPPRRTLKSVPTPAPIVQRAEVIANAAPSVAPAEEGVEVAAASTDAVAAVTPAAEEAPPVTPLRAERPLSPQGSIQFELYYGANRFLAGRSELSWEIADGRYRLASNGRTIGLAALFYPFGITSESGGRITAGGFEPDFFRLDRTSRKGEKQVRVDFDRGAGVARFSGPEGAREVPLRPSSLDILSLICQLSVARLEPGPMQLNLVNARKLDTYEVEVGGQEIVETPMGDLRAVYVKQLRKPGDEGIEVWLAVDFAYLPVRLRFTDRKGSIAGEQLVTAIQLARG